MMDRSEAGDRVDPRAGILLPAVLLLLLAGTLMAASLLVMARSAILLADGDRHLARALSVRAPLGDAGPGAAGVEGGGTLSAVRLPEGFLLVRLGVDGVGWSVWGVGWLAESDQIADNLQAAAEVGRRDGEVEGELVAAGAEEGCADLVPMSRWWVRASSSPPPPDPDLAPHPRLGPLGTVTLASRADGALADGSALPDAGPGLTVTEPGARVVGGSGSGLLVGLGTLELAGTTSFTGLVMAAGDLVLSGEAGVRGAVKAGEELRVAAGARVLGCRDTVREALEVVEALQAPFAVPGGEFLGRH